MNDKDQALKAIDDSGVRAGQSWRHYKGGTYTVIAVGIEEATMIPQVIYAGADGVVWVRRLVVFLESVDDRVPRFSQEKTGAGIEGNPSYRHVGTDYHYEVTK